MNKAEALAALHKILKPGDTVHTVIRSVAKSGMSRCMDVYFFGPNGEKQYLTGYCVALGIGSQSMDMWRQGKGMRVGGCGMDMGFSVVYDLGRVMFRDGFGLPVLHDPECSATKYRPASPQHAANLAARGVTFAPGRNSDTSGFDRDGGYALKQEWI